jgi:hypothetical protein
LKKHATYDGLTADQLMAKEFLKMENGNESRVKLGLIKEVD